VDDLAVARALHVLAVVIWIGGVATVTMVVLPSVRCGDLGPNRLQTFEAIWPSGRDGVQVGHRKRAKPDHQP
jgi:hypothetical protein